MEAPLPAELRAALEHLEREACRSGSQQSKSQSGVLSECFSTTDHLRHVLAVLGASSDHAFVSHAVHSSQMCRCKSVQVLSSLSIEFEISRQGRTAVCSRRCWLKISQLDGGG